MNPIERRSRGRGGYALMAVLLLVMAVGILALGAVTVVGNASLVNAYEARRTELEALADGGLEIGRARLNEDGSLFPATGYRTLENGAVPVDAAGAPIPGVRRFTYVGPIGQTSGQYGVYGSVVSVVEAGNARVVRRRDLVQESFARYAYFTDVEPSYIAFGGGDQISGPVHSNDILRIYSSRATFRGPGGVTTARHIQGKQYGTFLEGYTEAAPHIALPTLAELDRLRHLAQAGGSAFTAPNGGGPNQARMRIEFLTVDLNGDGLHTGEDEGFFRVYRTTTSDNHWTTASRPGSGWPSSENCGYWHAAGEFVALSDVPAADRANALRQPSAKCYLGGSDSLSNGFVPSDGNGQWVARPFNLTGPLPAALTGHPAFGYLFPLGRALNPEFKGVIHVSGKVAISGVVRGRVTLAATDRILIADDVTYAAQGAEGCTDILGLFGGSDVVVLDNALNAPQKVTPAGWEQWRTFDSTPDEFVHAVVLTLSTFHVENFDSGSNSAQACGSTPFGRGCLFLTGGIIQRTRGAVGTSGGTGYLKRYAYDSCAFSDPPPYFPTTGHFSRSRYYEIDPVGFSADAFFARMTGG